MGSPRSHGDTEGERAGRLLLQAAWGQIDWAAESVAHAVRDGVGEPIGTPDRSAQRHHRVHPREREFRAILASRGVSLDDELIGALDGLLRYTAAKAAWGVFALIDGVADIGEEVMLRVEANEGAEVPTYLSELFYEYDTDERNRHGK